MILRFKKLDVNAVIPFKAHETDAGLDLTAVSRSFDDDGNVVYGTGLAVEIPSGHVGLLFSRSSVARKDLLLSNCVGVIDSGYRGEVMMKFKALTPLKHIEYEVYSIGERIGQLVVMPCPAMEIEEADELSGSDRGEGGYGSTGK